MESKKRRYEDAHEGAQRPTYDVNSGIGNRLFFAMPGTEIGLRPGTEALLVDEIYGIRWEQVLARLEALGVLASQNPSEDGGKVFSKEQENLGSIASNEDGRISDVIEDLNRETEDALKIDTPDELRAFLRHFLLIEMRTSRIEHGISDLASYEEEVDELVTILQEVMDSTDPKEISSCIEMGKNPFYDSWISELRKYFEGNKPIQNIVDFWASGIGQKWFDKIN